MCSIVLKGTVHCSEKVGTFESRVHSSFRCFCIPVTIWPHFVWKPRNLNFTLTKKLQGLWWASLRAIHKLHNTFVEYFYPLPFLCNTFKLCPLYPGITPRQTLAASRLVHLLGLLNGRCESIVLRACGNVICLVVDKTGVPLQVLDSHIWEEGAG
jgi:hypothetical protein